VKDPVSAVEEQEPVKEDFETFDKKRQEFKKTLKVWGKTLGKNWRSEITGPITESIQQSLQPTVEKVGSFVNRTRKINERVRALAKDINNSTVKSALQELLAEHVKRKLNASSGDEAIANLLAEASRRRNASNPSATDGVVALQARRLRTGLRARNLTELLKINTSDPAWKLATKTVKAANALVSTINASAHSEGDVGDKIANFLHKIPIPADKGSAITLKMLPFIVGNAALKDVPMTSTERAAINFGLAAGTFGHGPHDVSPEEQHDAYERGLKAINDLKGQMGIKADDTLH